MKLIDLDLRSIGSQEESIEEGIGVEGRGNDFSMFTGFEMLGRVIGCFG
jgi:hypothetical protein